MLIHLENEDFDQLIGKGKVLVDFYADWCGPCKMLAPVLEEISREHGDLSIVKVNVDEHPLLAQKYSVMSIPSLIYFVDGKDVNHHVGFIPKEVLSKWF